MGSISYANMAEGMPLTEQVQRLLPALKRNFDLVVVVAAGMLTTPAKTGLSQLCDGVVFVVEAGRTRAPAARQAVETLRRLNVRVIGSVLNKQKHYIPQWLYKSL